MESAIAPLIEWIKTTTSRKKVNKNEMLKQISINTNEIYQYDILEVAVLNRFTKGAITNSYRKAHFP